MTSNNHPKQERTLVLIKLDGIQRNLVGEIITRYERSGLKLTALKMLVPAPELIERHYSVDPEWRRITGEKTIASYKKKGKTPPSEDPLKVTEIVLNNLKNYLSSGPVIAMVWQGTHAVQIVRKITGATEPLTSEMGTIRGDLTIDSYEVSDLDGRAVRNLVHASGNTSDAEGEIALWFNPEEVVNYKHIREIMLYDVNLDGLRE